MYKCVCCGNELTVVAVTVDKEPDAASGKYLHTLNLECDTCPDVISTTVEIMMEQIEC